MDRHGDVEAAIVAYPHGAAAPVVAALRARGVRVVDLSADFRLRERSVVRGVVRPAHGARPAAARRLRADRAAPRGDRRRRPRGQPRLLPDRHAARARAARARRARSPTSSSTRRRASAAPGARRRTSRTSWRSPRTSSPTRSAPTATRRRSTRSSALLGAPVATTFVPHLVPLDQGELVSCYVTPPRPVTQDELDALLAEAYDAEPFVHVVAVPPGVRDVRETNHCHVHGRVDPRTGKAPRLRRDRQPLEGRPARRRCRT